MCYGTRCKIPIIDPNGLHPAFDFDKLKAVGKVPVYTTRCHRAKLIKAC